MCIIIIIIGQTIDARLEVDERETTQLVLEIVNVAEKNGLKLPREFGLILKQVLHPLSASALLFFFFFFFFY